MLILYTYLTYNYYYPYLSVVQIFSLVCKNFIMGSVTIFRMLKGSKAKWNRQTLRQFNLLGLLRHVCGLQTNYK
jgi:hypothetical protein